MLNTIDLTYFIKMKKKGIIVKIIVILAVVSIINVILAMFV